MGCQVNCQYLIHLSSSLCSVIYKQNNVVRFSLNPFLNTLNILKKCYLTEIYGITTVRPKNSSGNGCNECLDTHLVIKRSLVHVYNLFMERSSFEIIFFLEKSSLLYQFGINNFYLLATAVYSYNEIIVSFSSEIFVK